MSRGETGRCHSTLARVKLQHSPYRQSRYSDGRYRTLPLAPQTSSCDGRCPHTRRKIPLCCPGTHGAACDHRRHACRYVDAPAGASPHPLIFLSRPTRAATPAVMTRRSRRHHQVQVVIHQTRLRGHRVPDLPRVGSLLPNLPHTAIVKRGLSTSRRYPSARCRRPGVGDV